MATHFGEADRDVLDREYDARLIAPAFRKDEIYRRESRRVLSSVERISDLVYDSRSESKLDIYPSAGRGRSLHGSLAGIGVRPRKRTTPLSLRLS